MQITTILAFITAMGGLEAVKWLVRYITCRKTDARKEEASVNSMEEENRRKKVDWLGGDGQLRKGGGLPAVPARAVDKEEDGSRFRPPEGGGSGSDGEGKLVHRGSFLPGGAGQGGHGKALFRQ